MRREEPLRDDDDLRVEARDEPALRDVERRVEARLVERERVLRRRVVPPLRGRGAGPDWRTIGSRPRQPTSLRGRRKRRMSPTTATKVAALARLTPGP